MKLEADRRKHKWESEERYAKYELINKNLSIDFIKDDKPTV